MALLPQAGPWSAIREAKLRYSLTALPMADRSAFIPGTRWAAAASTMESITLITREASAKPTSSRRRNNVEAVWRQHHVLRHHDHPLSSRLALWQIVL